MTAIQPALLSTLARAHADDLLAEADRQRLIRQATRPPIGARRALGRWLHIGHRVTPFTPKVRAGA